MAPLAAAETSLGIFLVVSSVNINIAMLKDNVPPGISFLCATGMTALGAIFIAWGLGG